MKNLNAKTKVLIVDDEPKNLKILRLYLGEQFELREAQSGEEALKVLESFEPAVVLLDIMMPGIDGYQVTKEIRANPKLKQLKIILISGRAMLQDKLTGYSCGANDYVTKPFDGEEVKAKLETFVKIYDLERQLTDINSSLEKEVTLRTEQLLASERMAFVGRHSCEIVHNLKNPLTILKAHLALLEDDKPAHPAVKKISMATDRILEFVKTILSANPRLENDNEEIDINSIIQEELQFIKAATSSQGFIQQKLNLRSRNLIFTSRSHLHQIIGNLIKNSVEAMEGMQDSHICIDTEDKGTGIQINITDSGPGMGSEVLSQLFTPLFTTKKGRDGGPVGNGLGLSYCKKMIESYGGTIQITSQLGHGTTIVVDLPRGSKPESKAA